jgi:2-methylcitrate dehydratase
MDKSTQQLVEFTLSASYEALDQSVIHQCKRRLIDTLGCAIGAFDDSLCTTVRELALQYRGPNAATLWGTADICSTEMAAFCNGVMLRVQDFNDTYFASDGAHPSDIMGAIVAVADAVRADGRALLLATATGYEVFCRLMQSVDVSAKNFDQTLYVSVAAALGIGQLMRLPRAELGHAVALAVTPHLALRQTRKGQLSHWKGCAAAEAARNAVFAANLAARGVTGPSEVFEGNQALWSIFGRFDLAARPDWPAMKMVERTHLKNLPVCYHAQAAAQAAIRS